MARKQERDEKMEALLTKLEEGIKAVFNSESYLKFLSTVSKFHSYSLNNQILIALQRSDATLVAGYSAWQTKFGRSVKRGEKGIQIIAYAPKTIWVDVAALNEYGHPILNGDGKPTTKKVKRQIPSFRPAYVFDVSQTEGEPLPNLGVTELTGNVERYEVIRKALEAISPVPVVYGPVRGDAKGTTEFMPSGSIYTPVRITVRGGMSQFQSIKTLIHEVAHARMHGGDRNLPELSDPHVRETEAESVAFIVCQHLGLDSSEYSFPYLATWSTEKSLPELMSSLERIRSHAGELIGHLDQQIEQLLQQQREQAPQQHGEQEPLAQEPALRANVAQSAPAAKAEPATLVREENAAQKAEPRRKSFAEHMAAAKQKAAEANKKRMENRRPPLVEQNVLK